MPETKIITFDHKEIARALVQEQGIKEGYWGIYLEFGIQGANISLPPSQDTLVPAAIVPVLKIGIQRFNSPNSLTVDASKLAKKSK
jgi:hypothetical protein